MQSFWQDLRFGARTLMRKPGFTASAVLTLALGISATTAIFSVFYATLYDPMPYPNPDQLVIVWSKVEGDRNQTSAGDYLEWKRRSNSFQYIEAATATTFNVATLDRPEQVLAQIATPGFLGKMFGYTMALGRDFLPEEAEAGKNRVVVLTHALWSQRFAANPEIIGQQIRMNGESYTVVGVTPPGQADRLPFQLWLPLSFKPEQINHDNHWLMIIGRLKPTVSIQQAQAEMDLIANQLAQEHPRSNANLRVSVEPLHNNFLPDSFRKSLWLLLGAVGVLLLIACVNIANLLLARGTTRRREVAIRAALGSARGRLFRQFLTESVLLAVVGGVAGAFLAWLIIDGVVALMPPLLLPSEADVRISLPVLLFTIGATMLAGFLFGCAPAWQATRLNLNDVLKQGGRTSSVGGRGLRRALVVVEFALALTLLAGGGLSLRSFWNLTRVELGVRTDNVLTFFLPQPEGRFKEREKIAAYYRELLDRIESVPGVSRAAVTTGMPLSGTGGGRRFTIVGAPPVDPSARPGAGFQVVTPGYFETLGIRLVAGRSFTDQDAAGTLPVAMVNKHFADRYLGGVDPLTQRIAVDEPIPGSNKPGPPVEWQIVGVFYDVHYGDLRGSDFPVIYVPFWQSPRPGASLAVRTSGNPNDAVRSVAAAVNSVDPDMPLAGVKTMDQMLDETLASDRFGLLLYGTFAILALLLAMVGIYSVMSFGVAQRTYEIGIRLALGAGRADVARLILREGFLLASPGLLLGFGGAYVVGRVMATTLYKISSLDVGVMAGAGLALLGAGVLACYIPARRATKVDPLIALRSE